MLVITAIAWSILIFKPGSKLLADTCCSAVTSGTRLSPGLLTQPIAWTSAGSLALGWIVMLIAMMGPMVAMPIRHILDRSFARQCARAVVLFLAGYVGIWMVAGILIALSGMVLPHNILDSFALAVLMLTTAFIWQCSPFKQRCLNRGHAHIELAAFGMAAELDAMRFGVNHGLWCVGSCWALMLVPYMFPNGHVAAMAVVTLWVLAERLERPMLPRWRFRRPWKAGRIVVVRARMLAQVFITCLL